MLLQKRMIEPGTHTSAARREERGLRQKDGGGDREIHSLGSRKWREEEMDA